MPTTASMPSASSASISLRSRMPPAAINATGGRRLNRADRLERKTASACPRCRRACRGTRRQTARARRRRPPAQCRATFSTRGRRRARLGCRSRRRSPGRRPQSANDSARPRFTPWSLKSADPTMTRRAPFASNARARSGVRTPPPIWHGSAAAIRCSKSSFDPRPAAASRSINCTSGYPENFAIQPSTSSLSTTVRSPCWSWTMWPFMRSIEGMSIGATSRAASARRVRRETSSDRAPSARRSGRSTRPARHRRARRGTRRRNAPAPPAPPEAITGIGTASLTAAVSSQSKPLPWCRRDRSTSAESRRRRVRSASRAHVTRVPRDRGRCRFG